MSGWDQPANTPKSTKDGAWAPIPGKEPRAMKIVKKQEPKWTVTSKAQLKKHTKAELVEEVYRLQSHVRSIAVELGICKISKSGELTIKPDFVNNTVNTVKAGWSFNL